MNYLRKFIIGMVLGGVGISVSLQFIVDRSDIEASLLELCALAFFGVALGIFGGHTESRRITNAYHQSGGISFADIYVFDMGFPVGAILCVLVMGNLSSLVTLAAAGIAWVMVISLRYRQLVREWKKSTDVAQGSP